MKLFTFKYTLFFYFLLALIVSCEHRNSYNRESKPLKKIVKKDSSIDTTIASSMVKKNNITTTSKSKKRALIVAISNYPPENGWMPTHAVNDIPLVKSALAAQGFQQVQVLENEKATKSGILQAIRRNLIDGASIGDKVVFHFSGHGQQVYDINGDELDSFDEALVPYDAPSYVSNNYKGELHLIDDELDRLFQQLRQKLGSSGSLLVTLDACYSGTATRSASNSGYYRGTRSKIVPVDATIQANSAGSSDHSWNLVSAIDDETLAPMIVISASQADQINHEIEAEPRLFVGSLSYALNQSLQSFPSNSSYRALYNDIIYHITSKVSDQYPYAEGRLDYQIFSANPQATPAYHLANQFLNDSTILISANLFNGARQGNNVSLFPAYTLDTKSRQPLATGTIVYTDFWQSRVVLQKKLSNQHPGGVWVISPQLAENRVKIKMTGNAVNPAFQNSMAYLQEFELVKANQDVLLELTNTSNDEYQIKLKDAFNVEVFQRPFLSEDQLHEFVMTTLTSKIKHINKVNLLRKLDLQSPNLNIDFKLIPVVTKQDEFGKTVVEDYKKATFNKDKQMQFYEDDYYKLKVINKSSFPVYFSIIDIYSNHEISQLYPVQATEIGDYVIASNTTLEIPFLYFATEPFGLDYLKLIASDQPFSQGNNATETIKSLDKLLPIAKNNVTNENKLTIKTIIYETLATEK